MYKLPTLSAFSCCGIMFYEEVRTIKTLSSHVRNFVIDSRKPKLFTINNVINYIIVIHYLKTFYSKYFLYYFQRKIYLFMLNVFRPEYFIIHRKIRSLRNVSDWFPEFDYLFDYLILNWPKNVRHDAFVNTIVS